MQSQRETACSPLTAIESEAFQILYTSSPLTPKEAERILSRVSPITPLSAEDAGRFAVTHDPAVTEMLKKKAKELKEEVFGKRIVLFAPLYLSNRCHNNCLYCGFRAGNSEISRKTLTPEEAAEQAAILSAKGFRRILLVCGESYDSGPVEYITKVVRKIYEKTNIRIVHLNAAPMEREELEEIKKEGIGVYQVFQETYHRETYERMHPTGRKSDYFYRLSCMDRAMEAGFDDVGIGALLGLYDWKFDCLSTILHANYLKLRYGTYPHTISVPRLKPAKGALITEPPHPVSDGDFLKIVALYRLCCPSSGVVVSTREPAGLREESLFCGASQISAGSSTSPGGYENGKTPKDDNGQFHTDDKRGLDEMILRVADLGLLPSLCTSCYRSGRTGAKFTDQATAGKISRFCSPNALLSLMELATESGDERLKRLCEKLIKREIEEFPSPLLRKFTEKLKKTMSGARDERF